MVLTFESVDENIFCYHSSETSSAVLSQRALCSVLQNEISPTKKSSTLRMIKVSASNLLLAWGRGVRIGKEKQLEVAPNGKRYR